MASEKFSPQTIPPELEGEMTPAVRAFVEGLLERIARLEGERRTPQNSSLPPSAQHPHGKPPGKKPSSARRRGGQPGHAKHERPLLLTEQCDEVHVRKPAQCRRRGATLEGEDLQPLRQQVWELPEIKPSITEYQLHRLACPHCGESTCAELPAGVPASQAGPRLVALVALLMAYFRQSKRRAALFLETILGQPCSAAWTVKLQKQATEALRPTHEELVAALPE